MGSKRLQYGIEKRIKVDKFWESDFVQVFAMAEDEDTPFVILRFFDYDNNLVFERYLTDVAAFAMVKQLTKALDILPSSK